MPLLLTLAVTAFAFAAPSSGLSARWEEGLQSHNPWHGFDDDDSILTVTRISRTEEGKCQPWLKALADTAPGTAIPDGPEGWATAWQVWGPWSKSDLDGVKDCDSFPCAVKLNRAETTLLAQTPEADRPKRFEALVAARVQRYRIQGPEAYESVGAVVDPWARLDKDGYVGGLMRPTAASGWRARQFVLDPNRMKTMHQILEARSAVDANEAELWIRSPYSDHYFDAWGEWRDVKCAVAPATGFTVTLVLLVDFDLLKNTDILSRIAHGRMRNAIRDNGSAYLDGVFDDLKAKAAAIRP